MLTLSCQPSKGIVPKFGSFKPKPAAKISEQSEHDGELQRHRSRSRDRKQHKRRKSRSLERDRSNRHAHPKDRTSRHERESWNRAPSPVIAKDEFQESDLFIVDRRGDNKIIEYGGLHQYDIPAHYRYGNGRVLGTAQNIRIDREASTEKQTALTLSDRFNGERSTRPFASKSKVLDPRGLRLILPSSAADQLDVESDYVELRSSLKRKRGSESSSLIVADVDYRSIEGKAKTEPPPDDVDMEYTTDSDEGQADDTANRVTREKDVALNKKVKDEPGDVDAWLALIEQQAAVVLPGQDPAAYTSSQRRTLADIRLAIYDRALKKVSKEGPRYDKLVLGRLKEGSTIWDNFKLAARWIEALKDNPSSIALWIKYLDFVQTDHINFRFEKCKQAYIDCFRMLNKTHAQVRPGNLAKVLSTQVYVLLRYTSFLRDAGYEELAHATWQIMLEYQFFKPPGLASTEEVLESLEAFWEGDVPRIGEEGAQGWTAFYPGISHGSRTSENISKEPPEVSMLSDSFAERETKSMDSFHLPATADEELDSHDPFRFVMFTDLRDVVENLLNDLPNLELINAFLCFIRLPPLASFGPHDLFWINSFLCQAMENLQLEQPASFAELRCRARIKYGKTTTLTLFHDAFDNLRQHLDSDDKNKPAAMIFVDHILRRLVAATGGSDELAEYYLAFTLHLFPENAANSAKRLLKLHSSSLRLYNAYALVEARSGNIGKAEDVWAIALKMSSTWPEEKRPDSSLLIKSRTMVLVRHSQEGKALRYLVDPSKNLVEAHLRDRETISATERLKATRILTEGFESMRARQMLKLAASYVDCLAWFSYLSDGHDLIGALAVYDKYIAKFSGTADSLASELLHQARAELLKLHMEKKRPYKPILVRGTVAESIRLFPDNSVFYEVQALTSVQTRVDDRLRDALSRNGQSHLETGLVSWCYALNREIERCSSDGSGATANSVRALFSNVLLSGASEHKHSPLLWTLWFEFELLVADSAGLSSGKQVLRQVLYDGLRCLPWYKPWIILGMRWLPEQFADGSGEMRRLYDVMTEREMRIRAELEDWMEG